MLQFIRKRALPLALLGLGFSFTAAWSAPHDLPNNTHDAAPPISPDQVVMLERKRCKPDRRCLVISAKKQQDGSTAYRVKALDNGEIMTIYDRKPKEPAKLPIASVSVTPSTTRTYSDPQAMQGIKTPPDVGQTSMPKPAIPQPVAQAPPKTSFFDRFFSKSPPSTPQQASTCTTCKAQPAVPPSSTCASCKNGQPQSVTMTAQTTNKLPANSTAAPGRATISAMEPPVVAPPVVVVPSEPLPVGFGPQLPMIAAQMRPQYVEPTPIRYEAPVDPVRQAIAQEQQRTMELKDALKSAERPSHRITAAEELCSGNRAQTADVRAAIMMAAQDDPAGCVRAACIRCLSHQGVRDTAFMTLLVSAQSDKDASVREEAGYAFQKATHR